MGHKNAGHTSNHQWNTHVMRILDVYYNQDFVGKFVQEDAGTLSFTYDTTYVEQKKMPISISLPLTTDTHLHNQVYSFFSGLLPDEHLRDKLAKKYGVSKDNPFSLLSRIGEDCAGAISFYHPGKKPPPVAHDQAHNLEKIDDKDISEIMHKIPHNPMLSDDEKYRLSLAGTQDKLPIRFINGTVYLVRNGTASTHIIKPPIAHVKDSVYNEYFCMQLAHKMGIPTPNTHIKIIGGMAYYIIDRYDRIIHSNNTVTRVHQEDFCQIMGIHPENKYQSEGGPAIRDCQNIITQHTTQPALNHRTFFRMVLFNFLVGNNDAHGKNFSVIYKNRHIALAPAYDILSTSVYPNLSLHMAMKLGKHKKPRWVFRPTFYRLGNNKNVIDTYINTMTKNIIDNAHILKQQMRTDGYASPVVDDIMGVIKNRSQKLAP